MDKTIAVVEVTDNLNNTLKSFTAPSRTFWKPILEANAESDDRVTGRFNGKECVFQTFHHKSDKDYFGLMVTIKLSDTSDELKFISAAYVAPAYIHALKRIVEMAVDNQQEALAHLEFFKVPQETRKKLINSLMSFVSLFGSEIEQIVKGDSFSYEPRDKKEIVELVSNHVAEDFRSKDSIASVGFRVLKDIVFDRFMVYPTKQLVKDVFTYARRLYISTAINDYGLNQGEKKLQLNGMNKQYIDIRFVHMLSSFEYSDELINKIKADLSAPAGGRFERAVPFPQSTSREYEENRNLRRGVSRNPVDGRPSIRDRSYQRSVDDFDYRQNFGRRNTEDHRVITPTKEEIIRHLLTQALGRRATLAFLSQHVIVGEIETVNTQIENDLRDQLVTLTIQFKVEEN